MRRFELFLIIGVALAQAAHSEGGPQTMPAGLAAPAESQNPDPKPLRVHVDITCFQHQDQAARCAQIRSLIESEIRKLDRVRLVDDDWMFELAVGVFVYPNDFTALPVVYCSSAHDSLINGAIDVYAAMGLYGGHSSHFQPIAAEIAAGFDEDMLSPLRKDKVLLAGYSERHYQFNQPPSLAKIKLMAERDAINARISAIDSDARRAAEVPDIATPGSQRSTTDSTPRAPAAEPRSEVKPVHIARVRLIPEGQVIGCKGELHISESSIEWTQTDDCKPEPDFAAAVPDIEAVSYEDWAMAVTVWIRSNSKLTHLSMSHGAAKRLLKALQARTAAVQQRCFLTNGLVGPNEKRIEENCDSWASK